MSVQTTSDATFVQDVLQSEKPVLVDFWAQWCGPCRMVSPILESIAQERDDIKIVKLNVDENPLTASRFGIQSIPTMLLFKQEQLAGKIIGAQPKGALIQAIDSQLGDH